MKKNVFYFNINYSCNNKCIYCLSHNTRENNYNDSMCIKDIYDGLLKWNFSEKDRIIVNGGEPTLHKELLNMLKIMKKRNSEVIMYSNGRKFKEIQYANDVLNTSINRITIPFHGNEETHDSITGIKGSFKETLEGVRQLLSLKSDNKIKTRIEIKFIINEDLIKSKFNITTFIQENFTEIKNLNSIVFAGVVSPKHESTIRKGDDKIYSNIGKYFNEQFEEIGNFASKNNITFKILDVLLCFTNNDFKKNVVNNDKKRYGDFIYFDTKIVEGRKIDYNKNHTIFIKCEECSYLDKCYCSLEKYGCLSMGADKKWYLGLE